MRRESATVVCLAGEMSDAVLAALGRSGNVSVARPPAAGEARAAGERGAAGAGVPQRGWEPGAQAMRDAARRRSMFVLVPADPLAGVAAAWRAMWEPAAPAGAAAEFEARAGEALAAWRDKRFELPDYYLVAAAQRSVTGPDFYLGPLHGLRPRRVAVAGVARDADAAAQAALLLDTLRSVRHGPWWPPLDELLDAVRRFYPGALAAAAAPA